MLLSFLETESVSLFYQNAIKMQFPCSGSTNPHLHLCMHPILSLSGDLHFLLGDISHTGTGVGVEELLFEKLYESNNDKVLWVVKLAV